MQVLAHYLLVLPYAMGGMGHYFVNVNTICKYIFI